MSRDGELRVDLRVPVRASRDDLAIALIRATSPFHVEGEDRGELSASGAEEKIKELFQRRGQDSEGWSDYMEESEREEWLGWARRQVDRAYPALAPGGGENDG